MSSYSYLFRKCSNGSVTLATLFWFPEDIGHQLFEVEIKNCDCEGTLLPIKKFNNLEEFIEYCNFVCSPKNIMFRLPILRKNPFPLEEMAKSCLLTNFGDSIDKLLLPKRIREDFQLHHDHFEITYDEKKREIKLFPMAFDFCDSFGFTFGYSTLVHGIINWKKFMEGDFTSGTRKEYF